MSTPEPGHPDDTRPWEEPGAVRRDCEPHRGPALRVLGGTSAAFGAGGMLLAPVSGFFLRGPAAGLLGFGVLCVCLAMGLSAVVLWTASRDLARMGCGQVDPAGREATTDARGYAGLGLLMGLLALLFLLTTSQAVFL